MRALAAFILLAASLGLSASPAEQMRPITAQDRVLVLAPHPDDESLGAGGLIQKSVAAGARVRVVFATNGDANPWAQRFAEHRLRIRPGDRARWGARRKKEALRALALLGVPPRDVVFLGLPDGGTSRLLMENDERTAALLRHAVGDWRPTVAVFPSRYDLHPDHNACFVLARLTLGPPRPGGPLELEYLVHQKPLRDPRGAVEIPLSAAEVEKKRAAILCHTSQTHLSRKRLLAFAQPREKFLAPGSARETDINHPLRTALLSHGRLVVGFRDMPARRTFYSAPVLLADDDSRRVFRFPRGSGRSFSAPFSPEPRQLFAKLGARGLFLDKSGWREVPAE